MDCFKLSRKGLIFNIVLLITLMIIYLFYINIFIDGDDVHIWIGAMMGGIIGISLRASIKEEREKIWIKILVNCCLPMVMILNYILFRCSIYIPNYILFFTVSCFGLIIFVIKSYDNHKAFISVGIVCIIFSFFAVDYYIKSNNIIKDINFRKYIAKEYNVKGKIEPNNLDRIERFHINSLAKINSIKGIEYFSNLKELYITYAYKINDFSQLKKLDKLNRLVIWDADFNHLKSMGIVKSIKTLEIEFPKYGKLSSLENFPNLKVLYVNGIDYMENLNYLEDSKNIETLGLEYSQIVTFDGIEKLENLEELSLHDISSTDASKISNLKNLKKITIKDCKIYKQDELIKNIRKRGIEVREQ